MILTDEDRDAIKAALLAHREDGVQDPRISLDIDVDGDGVSDAWALDEGGNVVLIPDVPVADTVFVATGDGVEAGGDQ